MSRPWLAVAGLVAALLLAGRESASADELLRNGGFEDGTAGWGFIPEDASLTVEFSALRAGQVARLSGGQATTFIQAYYDPIPIQGGADYALSGDVAVPDPASLDWLRLRIVCYESDNGTGLPVCQEDGRLSQASPDFTHVSTGLRHLPSAARSVRLFVVAIFIAPVPATLYLDDLSFQGPPAPMATATPSPSTIPTPSPTPAPSPPGPTPTPPPPPPDPEMVAALAEPLVYQQLVNGGFEEARTDGTPTGWRKVGGEIARSDAFSAEGRFAAAFTSRTESTKWMYQTVAVEGGAYYTVDAQALNPDPSAEAFLRVSWYAAADGTGQALSSADSTTIASGSPLFEPLTTGPVQAPADARSARVRLMLRPGSAAPATVYFDAVSLRAGGGPGPVGAGAASAAAAEAAGPPDAAPAILAAASAPGELANVRAPRAAAQQPAAAGGDGSTWPPALALGVPLAALAVAAGLEWRRRRLAAGDGGRL